MNHKSTNQQLDKTEPDWLAPKFENIPSELLNQPWAVWKAEPRLDGVGNHTGKWNKAPLNPLTGFKVGANQPEKFGTFLQAKSAYATGKYTGIGVLLTGSGITGIDIDNMQKLTQEGRPIIDWLAIAIADGIYCEASPSGTGLRLFVRGELSLGGRKHDSIEIYDNARFLTITGHICKAKVGA